MEIHWASVERSDDEFCSAAGTGIGRALSLMFTGGFSVPRIGRALPGHFAADPAGLALPAVVSAPTLAAGCQRTGCEPPGRLRTDYYDGRNAAMPKV